VSEGMISISPCHNEVEAWRNITSGVNSLPDPIFKHPAVLYCSMAFAGYVSVCVQLYCVGFHCLSLHVSAYTAIFKCVGALLCWFSLSFTTYFGLYSHLQVCRIFYFHIHEGFCFDATFLPFFFHLVTLHVSICVLFLWCFPSLFLLLPCVCLSACSVFADKQTHTRKQQK
jgi:hypothetical protein